MSGPGYLSAVNSVVSGGIGIPGELLNVRADNVDCNNIPGRDLLIRGGTIGGVHVGEFCNATIIGAVLTGGVSVDEGGSATCTAVIGPGNVFLASGCPPPPGP